MLLQQRRNSQTVKKKKKDQKPKQYRFMFFWSKLLGKLVALWLYPQKCNFIKRSCINCINPLDFSSIRLPWGCVLQTGRGKKWKQWWSLYWCAHPSLIHVGTLFVCKWILIWLWIGHLVVFSGQSVTLCIWQGFFIHWRVHPAHRRIRVARLSQGGDPMCIVALIEVSGL